MRSATLHSRGCQFIFRIFRPQIMGHRVTPRGAIKLGTPASVGTVIGDSQRRSRFQTQEIAAHEAQVPTLDDELAIICKPYTALDAPGPPADRADDLTIFLPTR